MFILVIIAFAGFSLYFLLKPPSDFQSNQMLKCESISEPELAVTEKYSMPTLSGYGKVF